MPVTLITGRPGHGKTLFAVRHIVEDLLPLGRPIFVNIANFDCSLSPLLHPLCPPEATELEQVRAAEKWFELPQGSIVVLDECQRFFPPRNGATKAPRHISEFETHRHKGFDLVLITQGPKLIDRALHDLIERHVHVERTFGMKRSTVFEWQNVNPEPHPAANTTNCIKKSFSFPKKYFEFYKSSSMHTVQARFPWNKVILAVAALALSLYMAWLTYKNLTSPAAAEAATQPTQSEVAASAAACVSVVSQSSRTLFTLEGQLFSTGSRFFLVPHPTQLVVFDAETGKTHSPC